MGTHRTQPVNIRSREVRDAVGRAQHRRQVLIFGLQLLFLFNILLVYRSTAQVSWKELVQSTGVFLFAAYAMFSLWCLHRSSRRRLRWIDVAISIVLDFALCMDVMFFQHETAATELRSAPLFSYVYLFIAMRCLHYRPSYVYLAGGLASLTWVLLLVITSSGSTTSLISAARGFTMSDAILSGVVDKLFSIVAVTVALALCVKEARKHMYTSAIRAAAGKGLARMVGESVAKEVLFSDEALVPGKGRQQVVAILMMDIRGFTKLAFKNDPSDVMALLAKYQQVVEPVIVKNGGCIDKFMGDGILAHFGALNPNPRYAAQALRCMEHLMHVTDRWNAKRIASGYTPLEFGLSCAVGEAVVGLVGGATKLEFTIIGDPVNITAKLEKHAKELNARAVTTAHAFDLARRQGFEPHYPQRVVKAAVVPGLDKPYDLVVMGDRAASSAAKPITGKSTSRKSRVAS